MCINYCPASWTIYGKWSKLRPMSDIYELSSSMQMYLKTILGLQEKEGTARVSDIADSLEVSKASVTSALRNLKKKGFVNYEPYGDIRLTDDGDCAARTLRKRYRVINAFLTRVLNLDADSAHRESCDLEHHISHEVCKRLESLMSEYPDIEIGAENCRGEAAGD